MRSLIVGLCLYVPTLCIAGEVWLTAPIASYHFSEREGKGKYEQFNPGLGLEYAFNERWRLGAGTYRSSIRTDASYLGAMYLPVTYKSLRFGLSAGVVSGYETNLSPILAPTAVFEWKRFGFNILFIPPTAKTDGGGLGFVAKWKLE